MRSPAPSAVAPGAAPAASGILAIDKPGGWTSFDVVAVVRGAIGARRVGHGGTLDPLATGLLPVLVGSATRYADRLHAAPKAYAAIVRFGRETTTDDAEGTTRREAELPRIDEASLDAALAPFRGEIVQTPPAFAAVKVAGRRAYRMARAGEEVTTRPRRIRVDRLAIAAWQAPSLRLVIVCGSGTYVRALARDVGRALGSAAHLGALRRLAVGALDVKDAIAPGKVRAEAREATVARLRAPGDDLLTLDAAYLSAPATELLRGWEPDV